MARAERVVIPRCIGCGAMFEPERCEDGCSVARLELVAVEDLDALESALRATQARIDALLPVARALAAPPPERLESVYRSVARSARAALHDAPAAVVWPAPLGDPDGPLRIDVWRCAICGAVDAPQECLGICIWRRFEWVGLDDWKRLDSRAHAASVLERRLTGLLGRLAYATPRADAWALGWRTLSSEARELISVPRADRVP